MQAFRFMRAVLIGSICAIPVLITLHAPMAAAAAAQSNALIEEVVVTARKRTERLQDIPASAAALSSDFIEDIGGVNNLRDITDLIPGISINETQAGSLTEPTIRGAGQSRNRASVSATGLYRNGAYFATNSFGGKNFARLDTYDLERVEVLRGPQGALYGRNALGGSMNLISKKPTDQFEIDLGIAAGEEDTQRYDGKVNVPINEQIAIRASHVYEKRGDSYYTGLTGQGVDHEKYQSTRASVRYQPNESWDINYVFDTQKDEPIDAYISRTTLVPDLDDAFETTVNSRKGAEYDVDNHNLVIDWNLGQGTLTSVSNYRDRKYVIQDDSDYTGPTFAAATRNLQDIQSIDNDIFFQEIRYGADTVGNLTWLVGADYFTHDNTEIINGWVAQTVANSQYRTVNMSTDSWAAFGSVEYRFDEVPVTLTAELRYAEDKIDGDVVTYRRSDQPGLPDINNPVNPETDFSTSKKFTNLPWGLTAAYRFVEQDVMAYAKVASSYRHGGMNLNQGSPGLELYPAVLTYGEETSITYELGVKTSWFDRALTVNADVYYTDYNDFLNTTDNGCPEQCQLVDVNGNGLGFNPDGSRVGEDANGFAIPPNNEIPVAFFIDNVGKAYAWGFEIEGTYKKQFDYGGTVLFNLGYARGKGEVKSLNDDVSEATEAVADGAKLPFLRPNQVKSSVVYRQALGSLSSIRGFDGAALVASATYTYEEGGPRSLTNVSGISNEQDTVKRLNAHLGLETTNWSLFVRGENLTDYDYKTWENSTFYIRNLPRYVYGELTVRLRP
ncbi:MAG: TonB-dependent receptor [Pseudomonadales bacterium]